MIQLSVLPVINSANSGPNLASQDGIVTRAKVCGDNNKKPTIGWAKRNAAPLNLKIAANTRCICYSFLPLDGALAYRTVSVIVSGSDGQAGGKNAFGAR